jgi:hypothetical protein
VRFTALGDGAKALPVEVTVRVASIVIAPADTGGVNVIDTFEVPTAAFLQPGCMLRVTVVPAAGVAATLAVVWGNVRLFTVTAFTGAVPAASETTTGPLVASAMSETTTGRGVGPSTVSQVRAIAAGAVVNPAVACRVPAKVASASTASGSFEKSNRDIRLFLFFGYPRFSAWAQFSYRQMRDFKRVRGEGRAEFGLA